MFVTFIRTAEILFCNFVALTLAIGFAAAVSPSPAQDSATPAAQASGQSDDISAAIKQRIASGQWDQAAQLAERHFDAIAPGDVEAAKWAIALSKLRVEILLRSPIADQQPLIVRAAEPIERILSAYPDHRFAFGLRFQRLAIDTAVARRNGLAIQAAPGEDTARLSALASLIETAGGLRDLQTEVVEAISTAFAQRHQPARIDQLMSLRNAIATERVGVLLSRGELFPADSDDFLAAAEAANRAAIEALEMVRNDSAVQNDLVTMRCDALLRMGQPDEAARLVAPLLSQANATDNEAPPLTDATRAIAVRIAIELQQLAAAQKWLDSHYGDQPQNAPPSPESDLVRLRFLIASESDLAGSWIETVRDRGGDYLYRRAQRIAIQLLGPDAAKAASGEWVIAEAAVLLRKGDPAAAAKLLETQLQTNEDAPSALKVATVAAAVYMKDGRQSEAADVLAKTATRFAASDASAALMLQAAVILDKIGEAAKVDRLLRDLMRHWPTNRSGMQARDWLTDRTEKTATTLDAAIVATPDPATDTAMVAMIAAADNRSNDNAIAILYDSAWRRAEALWIRAFAEVQPFDPSLELSQAFRDLRAEVTRSLGQSKSPAALRCRKTIATLFLEAQPLNEPELGNLRIVDKPLIDWLYAIRSGGAIVAVPESQDNNLRAAAGIALMIDGQKSASMRATIGDAMTALLSNVPGAQLAHSQAAVWTGNWQLAPTLLDSWIADRPSAEQAEIASMQAAKLLSQANDPAAKEAALGRYLNLSKAVSSKSPRWHSTKLATIESMIATGKADEAQRLARYILITRPPSDEETKASYEDLAK